MQMSAGDTLLFTGDSITDCGRDRPVGVKNGLGAGYVALVRALIGAFFPEREVGIMNTGISGNRVIDLEARWDSDVLAYKPDWVSVCIGINDVWRYFDSEYEIKDRVDEQRYETTYRRLIEQTLPKVKGMVLMTPFYLELNLEDPMRKKMDRYSAIVRKLASEYNCVFVDTQAAFDRYLQVQPTQRLCPDRVHPNQTGHMVIARAFLEAAGFDWSAAK